jgi:TonB family protein
VSPGIDKEVIRRVVRAHINEVRHCYNQGLVRDPNLMGRVAVQFTIGATGRVPVAVIHESSVKDRNVARCIAKAVQRWRFPRPRTAGHVMVTYPFVLSPG